MIKKEFDGLVAESSDLHERIGKLYNFIYRNEKFDEVCEQEQVFMVMQLHAMIEYSGALEQRIRLRESNTKKETEND